MKAFTLAAALCAAFTLSAPVQATEFIVNGNFSSLSNGFGQLNNNTVATGWSTAGYNFVMNNGNDGASGNYGFLNLWTSGNGGSNSWDGLAPGGSNFLMMDGAFEVDEVSQTITGLTPGQSYRLTFDYAFSQQRTFDGATIQNITTTFGSDSVVTADFNVPNHGFVGWQSYAGNFTATSASQVLSFLAYGNIPVPPMALLTNVSLTENSAVPEPDTWAMMLIGFGMIGALARRRRFTVRALAA